MRFSAPDPWPASMVLGLPLGAEVLPWLFAGVGLLGLAGWLLHLDWRKPVNQALALFLVLRGLVAFSSALAHNQAPVPPGSMVATASAWSAQLSPALHISLPFAAIHFGLIYRTTYLQDTGAPGGTRWPLVLVLPVVGLYFLDPSLWGTGATRFGPLFVFAGLTFLSYALLALTMAWDHTHGDAGPVRGSFLLVALGFSLSPLYLSIFEILALDVGFGTGQVLDRFGPWFLVSHLLVDLSLIPCLGVAWLFLRTRLTTEDPTVAAQTSRALIGLAFPVATALAVAGALHGTSVLAGITLSTLFEGLWDLILPVIIAYALLRHQLFGVDAKLRTGIERSTLAGIFAGVFVVVSESVELVLPVEGALPSFLGALAIALALAPLQKIAERATSAILPGVENPGQVVSPAQRRAMYREQVRIALADGDFTEKDRRMLDTAAEHLDVRSEQARRIEAEVREAVGPIEERNA